MPSKYAKSSKFAALSANERARRIAKIEDPKKRAAATRFWADKPAPPPRSLLSPQSAKLRAGTEKILRQEVARELSHETGFGGFLTNLGETVPKTAAGLVELSKQVGTGAYRDLRSGKGLWKPGGLAFGESEGRDIVTEQVTAIPGQMKLLADPHEWYENPGFQIMNVASLALPFARAASVARLAQGIRAANPALSLARVNKLALAESFHPGFVKAKGLEGGIAPRVVKGKYGEAPGRMPSRQPIVRGGQRAVDKLSEAIDARNPERPFSASRRAQAQSRRLAIQETRRARAVRQATEEALTEAVTPSKRGRTARFWGLGTKVDPSIGAALVASLEGPAGASVRDAVKLRIDALNSVLEQNKDLRPKQDAIDDLHAQRRDVEAEGGDTAEIDSAIKQQQAALDFSLGKNVAPVTGSPIRDLVHKTMVETIGKKRANESIKVWDARARAAAPEDPASWYTANIAGAQNVPLAQFTPEGTPLYQRMRESDPERWHFEVQEALQSLQGRTMQVGQLMGALTKAGVKQEELRNSGLQRVFQSLGKNTTVAVDDVLDDLREERYFSRYDPDVSVRNDGHTGPNTEYGPHDSPGGPALVSREGLNGEYHEMVITLPDLEREPFEAAYRGRGESHWGEHNVVYHVRFQVYMQGDKRVLLIEEIQSDWASDYRRAKKQGAHVREPEEAQAERARLEAKLQEQGEELAEAERAYDEWLAEKNQRVDEGIELDPAFEGQGMALLSNKLEASDDFMFVQSDLNNLKRNAQRGHLPSPMHQERYLDNALHNLMRYADDNQVDEVVVIDGGTQAVRNRAIQLEEIEDEAIHTEDGFQDYGEWVDGQTGEPLSNEKITRLLETQPGGSFTRSYNEQIPERLRKLYDAEPEFSDSAYVGRYSAQPDPYDYGSPYNAIVQMEDSSMPGTIVRLTPEVKGRMRESRPLYRRDFEGIPQGATEFLADGRARVTMFEKADVSTWVHEFAHVALKDLDPADQAVLERELADGRKIENWTEADNEAYAQAFETYMRDGYAAPALREVFAKITQWMKDLWAKTGHEAEQLHPEVADTFDRMLGRRHQNTVVLDDYEIAQVTNDIQDLQKALDSGDVDKIKDAAEALTSLSKQAEAAGIELLMRNAKSPEHAEAILEGLVERKNAIVEDYRRRGLIGYGEEANGYFPQFSQWEALGMPGVQPSRIAATGSTVGTPRITSKAINRNKNKLVRYQTGEVLNDPTAVIYILRARLRLQETIKARNELWNIGEPIRAGEPIEVGGKVALVRNPDVAPERMRTATEAAASLTREDYTRLQKRRAIEDVDEVDTSPVREQMIWTPEDGPRPEWTFDEKNVRAVPLKVATKRLGDVFNSGPRNAATATLGMANSAARAALIYAPLGGLRYVFRNWVQNAVLMAMTQPSAFLKLATNRKLRNEHPELWDRINEEFGTIQAQALPEFNTRAQTRMQRGERRANQISGQVGEHLGRFADVPLRAASWRRHAERYGFTTPEEYEKLLDDPDLLEIRNTISQRVREDMIDFDALSPYEKEVLTRYLFIWPFVRGATKWPFMYAREYPMRLAIAGQLAGREQGDRSLKEILKAGDFDLNWLNPAGPMIENAQRLQATGRRVSKGNWNLSPLAGILSPQLQMLIEAFSGNLGKDAPHEVMSSFIPGYSTVEAALGGKGKVKDFGLKAFGKQTRPRSVAKKADEWIGELDAVLKTADEKGFTIPPAARARVERMRAAYGDWIEDSSRAKWAKQDVGIDETDDLERTTLLLAVMREHYRSEYDQLQAESEQATGMSAEDAVASDRFDNAKIYRAVYDQMFGLKEEIMADAKEAGWSE